MKTYELLNELYNATNQEYPSKKISLRLRRMNYDHIYSYNQDVSKYVEGSAKYIKAVRNNRKSDLVRLFKTNIQYKAVGLEYKKKYDSVKISKVTFTLDVKQIEYDYDTQEEYTYDMEIEYILFLYENMYHTGKDLIKRLELEQELIEEGQAMNKSNDHLNDMVNQYRLAEEMEVKVYILNKVLGHHFTTATSGMWTRVGVVGEKSYSQHEIHKMIKEYENFVEFKAVEDEEYVTYSKVNGSINKSRGGSSCTVSYLRLRDIMNENVQTAS